MGSVLSASRRDVLEASQSAGDVTWHGNVNVTVGVIPGQSEAAVQRAVPLCGDGVELAKRSDEMLSVVFADILDAEVVDNKGEGDGSSVVTKKSGSVWSGVVTVFLKMLDEALIGQNPSLRKAVHSLADLHHDMVVVNEGGKVVLLRNGRRDKLGRNPHVLEALHGGVEVEIFDVDCHEARRGSR